MTGSSQALTSDQPAIVAAAAAQHGAAASPLHPAAEFVYVGVRLAGSRSSRRESRLLDALAAVLVPGHLRHPQREQSCVAAALLYRSLWLQAGS